VFIDDFLIGHNFLRFTTDLFAHRQPFYFYLPVLLFVTFPWAFQLIPVFSRRWNTAEQILAAWWIAPLALFTMSTSKLPGYILPAVPGVVLMCAQEFRRPASRTSKIAAWFEVGTLAFIGVAFGFYGTMLRVDPHLDGKIILAITFALAAAVGAAAIWLNPSALAVINLSAMILLTLAATTFVLPRFDRTETMRPWKHALDRIAAPDAPVCLYRPDRWMEYGMLYYRPVGTETVNNPEDLAALAASQPRLCIAEDATLAEIKDLPNLEIEIVQKIGSGKQSAFLAKPAK
jgi:4-amino-4-deoxy-L-arabinose transferase-like glycosyltransferase